MSLSHHVFHHHTASFHPDQTKKKSLSPQLQSSPHPFLNKSTAWTVLEPTKNSTKIPVFFLEIRTESPCFLGVWGPIMDLSGPRNPRFWDSGGGRRKIQVVWQKGWCCWHFHSYWENIFILDIILIFFLRIVPWWSSPFWENMELGTIFPSASSSKQIQEQQLFNLFWNYQAMKVSQYSHIGNYPRVRRFYWFLAVQLNCNCLDLKSYWNQYCIFDSCNLFSKTISKSKSHVLTIPTNFPPFKSTKYYCWWKISGDHQLRERYFISLLTRNNTYQVVFSPEFLHPSTVIAPSCIPKTLPFSGWFLVEKSADCKAMRRYPSYQSEISIWMAGPLLTPFFLDLIRDMFRDMIKGIISFFTGIIRDILRDY